MSLSATLWQTNLDLARASLEHPFVQGIGNGDLPPERFAYYVGQDAFYLEAFARAFSIAAARAPDWEGFRVLHTLIAGVLEELQLHAGYAAAWNVDMRTVEPGIATRRYTDFLLTTAWGNDTGLTAVAMSPCMQLYAFLGQELARIGIPDHRYANWIRTYSDPQFMQLVHQLQALIDRYASATPLVQQTYRYAMQCEHDFFQAAWEWRAV